MTFYTYIYRDPIRDNEPFYVGKGKGTRAKIHLKRVDRHPFVQRIQLIQNLGHTPVIEIIVAIDEAHAFFLETCLIDILGRKNTGAGPLLNLTDGGEGSSGYIASDETKKKLKATQHLRGMNGRKHTDETKRLIAAKITGTIIGPRDETVCQRISETKQANPFQYSDEMKQKMRGVRGLQRKEPCRYCSVVMGLSALNRLHNDRCPQKNNSNLI